MDYCKAQTSCEGGNVLEVEACRNREATNEEIAGIYECDAKYELAQTCKTNKSTCQNNLYSPFSASSGEDRCEVERRQLLECVEAASGRGSD
jgi:hypothetical protein